MSDYSKYEADLVVRFREYRDAKFSGKPDLFDGKRGPKSPPVFSDPSMNIIADPDLSPFEAIELRSMLPKRTRHRWFGSMKSSQALVQSVFGNLRALNLCSALEHLKTEDGVQPFQGISPYGQSLFFERITTTLGESNTRSTSVDVWVQGPPSVAIECKLAEPDIGRCSRPHRSKDDEEYCNGSYSCQHGRRKRCALVELGIKYWDFVPKLFKWGADEDHKPCPLHSTYQLVRNVLAASIDEDGAVVPGFAVLLADERNPAFQENGKGGIAFAAVRDALPYHP
jgi:hypothetical protein